ncbi:zeta toxin family protein [Larkinella sp. VNQ87]|uniref:zeta toxin family protein n=1 Tax=Larkinella sp. VNQ87 TaxID=3400921 RepID=UPI003C0C3AEE
MPKLFILAGCNGAGKTTAAYTILPDVLNIRQFVNADEIARGLSPFEPESVALEAGRMMLNRMNQLLEQQVDFAFETTLSTRSYVQTIKRAQQAGYSVTLFYVWLESVELAKERVAARVARGGHSIPPEVIERRYKRSIQNLMTLYLPICNRTIVVNNSTTELSPVAECWDGGSKEILDESVWFLMNHHEF